MSDRTPDRQPSSTSRRSSLRHSNPDIFSDEFALDSIVVADGFRPSITRDDDAITPTSARSPPRTTIPRRSVALQYQPDQSPKSVRRKQLPQGFAKGGSVSSRSDGAPSMYPHRTASAASTSEMSEATSSHQRPSSIISGYSMPRRESVYRGSTGPSHPYAMYPQDTTLNRTSTISSLRPPDRSYSGPSGPTHPYGMYPQNTVPEGDISMEHNNTAPIAPVGFPGRSQQYTRRLGPDGEEADDIIGPDGHLEQLPPYTRYPDAILTKENYAPGDPESQLSPHSPLQMTPTQGSSEEVQHSDDERAHINPTPPGVTAPANQRFSTKERWVSRGKKRTCCGAVPRWAVVVMVVLAVLLAAVLGGVISRVIIDRNKKGQLSGTNSKPPLSEVT